MYIAFLRPLLSYASSGWFPFLSVTNITKLKCLYRAASHTITCCLSSSPIPFLFSEASLPPLRVTLAHFTLSFYERALRLPTSFPISGLARFGVKPRLCRCSWRAFASTHSPMLPSLSPKEALLACPACPPQNLPSFTVESTLFSPCFHSDLPLSYEGAALAHLDSLPFHDLVLWTDGSFAFPFGKGGSGVLDNCSLCGTETTLSFSARPVRWSFLLKPAPFCKPFAGLGSTNKPAIPPLLSSPLIRLSFCPSHPVLSSVFPSTSNSVADLAGTVLSLLLFYQATIGPWIFITPGKPRS